MTPTRLLECFQRFAIEQTKDMLLQVKTKLDDKKECRPPEVHLMRLPERSAYLTKAPYIILQLLDGKDDQQTQEQPENLCHVQVVICIYSEDASEGALQVLGVIERLRLPLLRQRVLGKQFSLQMPMEYQIYPDSEEPSPYFLGVMTTIWELPKIEREVIW